MNDSVMILSSPSAQITTTAPASENATITSTERLADAAILCLILIVAVIGNFALWVVVCLSPALRTLSNALLLCLSTADILVSLVSMPVTIFTILVGGWQFSDTVCTVMGFTNMVTFIASVMSLAAISWNRYAAICRPTALKIYFSRQNTAIVITVIWCVSIALACPPLFGWGVYGYLPRQSFCFCEWTSSVSYTFFMVFTCFGIPFVSMSICYIRILKEVRASRRRIGHFDGITMSANGRVKVTAIGSDLRNSQKVLDPPTSTSVHAETMHIKISIASTGKSSYSDPGNKLGVTGQADLASSGSVLTFKQKQAQKRMREELRLVASLLVVVIIFIVAWLPFCVTMFWSVFGGSNPPPRTLDMFTLLLGYTNSCCNPIVYGIMNKRFNNAFKKLFKCQCARVSQIVPTDISSHYH